MKHSVRTITTTLAGLAIAISLAACAPASTTTTAPAASQAEATAAPAAEANTSQEAAPAATEAPAAEAPAAADAPAAEATVTKLNLNTVSGEELLAAIPGFGNRMVREFQEYRPYASIQQFRKEIGKYVDAAQVADYEKYVFVPINVNESDAATLMQIAGLDDAKAQELIAARPFASNDAFLEKLATLVSADEAAAAKGYLEAQ
jgi:DNA uptake protein ComE-like DNA-binding protein